MIRYTLKCADGHDFESWFKSAAAYDALRGAGQVSCPLCGTDAVEKALMAPRVRTARGAASEEIAAMDQVPDTPPAAPPAATNTPAPLSESRSETERAIKAMRDHVEANSDYVGMKFTQEARAMHDGDIPARPIYGEANLKEAKALIEDGVPVVPLPFTPKRQTN